MLAAEALSPVLAVALLAMGIVLLGLVGWLDHRTEGRPRRDAAWPTSGEERRLMRGNQGLSLLMIDHTGQIEVERPAPKAAPPKAAPPKAAPPKAAPPKAAPPKAAPVSAVVVDTPSPAPRPASDDASDHEGVAPRSAMPKGASQALDALFGDILGDRVA